MNRFLAGLILLVIVGCSGSDRHPTAKVSGRVTYQNKPVPGGTIMFVPEGDKPTATGELKPDGTYELTTYDANDGAVLGPHTVMITAVEQPTEALPEVATPKTLIPAKYTNNSTSGLTAEVADKEVNTIDFNLK